MTLSHFPRLGNRQRFTAFAVALLAIGVPALLAYNEPPSATFFNQAAAVIGWSVLLMLVALSRASRDEGGQRVAAYAWLRWDSGSAAVSLALALLAVWATASTFSAGFPSTLSASAVSLLLAAALVFHTGRFAAREGMGVFMLGAVCVALAFTGLISSVLAILQIYIPEWTGNGWIAAVGDGRAAANLRQANHLGTLLLWSCVAVVWLVETSKLDWRSAAVLSALYVFGLVLTGSRTVAIGVITLGVWGLLDGRLSRASRRMLLLTPLLYAFMWWLLTAWSASGEQPFAGAERLTTEGAISSGRLAIWSNALALIARYPWLGVGWGEFNLAWTLTPFPGRPAEFFDHTHNLLLHLLVEFGVPLGSLVFGLLAYALWRAFVASRNASGAEGTTRRAAFMLVLLIGIHSQLEYPLWYAYFLFPAAFAWGLCFGGDSPANTDRSSAAGPVGLQRHGFSPGIVLAAAALLVELGGVYALLDYQRVSAIFWSVPGDAPLEQRIAEGKRSVFFSHHAHYAAATTAERPSTAMESFDVAKHYLLDTRLMVAWAHAFNEAGDVERARHIAARLREFGHPDSQPFFAPCDEAPNRAQTLPFQCAAPTRAMDDRDFR